MGYLGRRIGLSQNQGDSNPGGADGAVGGGILNLFENGYFEKQGDLYNAPGSAISGMNASGGTAINEYQTPDGKYYRAHIFTGSGTFTVTDTGNASPTANSVEYLVVGGGGSGGTNKQGPPHGYGGGGGGAGGVRVALASHPLDGTNFTVAPGTSYPVVIGAGGEVFYRREQPGRSGSDSSFGPPSSPERIIATGGGYGASNDNNYPVAPAPAVYAGGSGGSGGGGCQTSSTTISGLGNTPPAPVVQGYPGGTTASSGPNYFGGGGGGASEAGVPGNPGNPAPTTAGQGGDGVQVLIGGPPSYQQIGALDPGPGEYQWFGGGGGGSQSPNFPEIGGTAGHGGKGGGGTGRQESQDSTRGQVNTGGGGGGGVQAQPQPARRGGSGIVVIRY